MESVAQLFADGGLLRQPARRRATYVEGKRSDSKNHLRGDTRAAADAGTTRLRRRPGGWRARLEEPGGDQRHADQIRHACRRLAHGRAAGAPAHRTIVEVSASRSRATS